MIIKEVDKGYTSSVQSVLDDLYVENGKIIEDYLVDSIDIWLFNTRKLYDEIKNKSRKSYSIAYEAMLDLFQTNANDNLYPKKIRVTSEMVKRWFSKYGADFKEILKPVVAKIDEDREELINESSTSKFKTVSVLQGNYGYGWDDLCYYEDNAEGWKEQKDDIKTYRENEPEASFRIITRKEPNPDYKAPTDRFRVYPIKIYSGRPNKVGETKKFTDMEDAIEYANSLGVLCTLKDMVTGVNVQVNSSDKSFSGRNIDVFRNAVSKSTNESLKETWLDDEDYLDAGDVVYEAKAYYNSRYSGLAYSEEFTNAQLSDLDDWIWDMCQRGFYVTVYDYEDGEYSYYRWPDNTEHMELFQPEDLETDERGNFLYIRDEGLK